MTETSKQSQRIDSSKVENLHNLKKPNQFCLVGLMKRVTMLTPHSTKKLFSLRD